jgi:hypothetical protein
MTFFVNRQDSSVSAYVHCTIRNANFRDQDQLGFLEAKGCASSRCGSNVTTLTRADGNRTLCVRLQSYAKRFGIRWPTSPYLYAVPDVARGSTGSAFRPATQQALSDRSARLLRPISGFIGSQLFCLANEPARRGIKPASTLSANPLRSRLKSRSEPQHFPTSAEGALLACARVLLPSTPLGGHHRKPEPV